jgi:hypothetical protein
MKVSQSEMVHCINGSVVSRMMPKVSKKARKSMSRRLKRRPQLNIGDNDNPNDYDYHVDDADFPFEDQYEDCHEIELDDTEDCTLPTNNVGVNNANTTLAALEEYSVSLALQISLDCEGTLSQWTNVKEKDDDSSVRVEDEEWSIVSDLGSFSTDDFQYTYNDAVTFGKSGNRKTKVESAKVARPRMPAAVSEARLLDEQLDDIGIDLDVFDDVFIRNGAKCGHGGKRSLRFKGNERASSTRCNDKRRR